MREHGSDGDDMDGVNGRVSPVLDADVIALYDGTLLVVHAGSRCLMGYCVIHNPSDHPLAHAPLIWDESLHLMFRMCMHGKPHPDPDAMAFSNVTAQIRVARGMPVLGYDGWHPCCDAACCIGPAAA